MVGLQLSFWVPSEINTLDLVGKRVAITGKLDMLRSDAMQLLCDSGGIYTSTVSRTTDYLVLGDLRRATSRKLVSARKLQSAGGKISIVSPYDFYRSVSMY